ncbi:MAG: hypothetical protein MHM6MM_006363, partial [Cercozoa sp. M6MM]
MSANGEKLRFRGASLFRWRVLLSTLTGRDLIIRDIRSQHDHPGLHAHEAAFLRLISQVTNGGDFRLSDTTFKYRPGTVRGGRCGVRDCGGSRALGYFLEPLIILALFSKRPIV